VQRKRAQGRGSRKKHPQRAKPISPDEWLTAVKSELSARLAFNPDIAELDLAAGRILREFLSLCEDRKADRPYPSERRRDSQVDGRLLRGAAKAIERQFEGGATSPLAAMTMAAMTMAATRRSYLVRSDRPRLGASPADVLAVLDTIDFLRRLADAVTYEPLEPPESLKNWYAAMEPMEKKKRYVWRIAVEWSALRRQEIATSPVGSPEQPSRLLAFLFAATQPLHGVAWPRGLSEATLRRLATELVRVAGKYNDRYVHLLAGKASA
jgi:hypothetical protein